MITENYQPNRRELYEILEYFEKISSKKEKIEFLKQNANLSPFTDYLRCVFDDLVQFNLPGGKPPYEPSEERNYPSSWFRQNKKLEYFVKGLKGDNLLPVKRETMFISILESVHPKDAEILVAMINKKSITKGLTKKLVQEALPNLIVR